MDPRAVNIDSATKREAPPRLINGRRLAQQLKAGTVPPEVQIRLTLGLEDGEFSLSKLPNKLSRLVTGASRADVARARRENRNGKSRNGNGGDRGHHARVFYRNNPTDSDIDALIAKYGTERMRAALNRNTVYGVVNKAKSFTDALHGIAHGLSLFADVTSGADWVLEGALVALRRFSPFAGISEAGLATVRRTALDLVSNSLCFDGDLTPVAVMFAIADRLDTVAEEEAEEEAE